MIGYTYILLCSDGSYYTGSTKDLEKRLEDHQNGKGANYTKRRLPIELVYVEEYERIDTAFYREKQIQGWSRKKKEALINGNFAIYLIWRNARMEVISNIIRRNRLRLRSATGHSSRRLSSRNRTGWNKANKYNIDNLI